MGDFAFHDGSKRFALVSIDVFLQVNDHQLIAEEVDAVLIMRDVASGAMEEPDLAEWFRENSASFKLDSTM